MHKLTKPILTGAPGRNSEERHELTENTTRIIMNLVTFI